MADGDGKFRHMTPEEERIFGLELDRDGILRDWQRAERVVDAARALPATPGPERLRALRERVADYDAYIAAEKAEAERLGRESGGLPERGLVSRSGISVKGDRRPDDDERPPVTFETDPG